MDGLAPLENDIAWHLKKYRDAETQLQEQITETQARCEHVQVLCASGEGLTYFGSLAPLRMCVACRLEEEGSRWSDHQYWSATHNGPAVLGQDPARLVIRTDRQTLYALRLPGPRHIVRDEQEKETC